MQRSYVQRSCAHATKKVHKLEYLLYAIERHQAYGTLSSTLHDRACEITVGPEIPSLFPLGLCAAELPPPMSKYQLALLVLLHKM